MPQMHHNFLDPLCSLAAYYPGQGFGAHPSSHGGNLNWQQQLQQQLQGQLYAPLQPQGMPQPAPGAESSSSNAADSWSWLDDFEHKQQAERQSGR